MGRSGKITPVSGKSRGVRREYTVVLLPVFDSVAAHPAIKSKKNGHVRLPETRKPSGYQVSVPALPGVITYGRTESEAWTMAQDAIRCHIEGLQKDGEQFIWTAN